MVLLAICGYFAGDDVVGMANGKAFHGNASRPRFIKRLDAVGRKNEVYIERSGRQLHEVLAAANIRRLLTDMQPQGALKTMLDVLSKHKTNEDMLNSTKL